MPVELDKLTRIIRWVEDEVEFLQATITLSNRFDIDIETLEDGTLVGVGQAFGDVGPKPSRPAGCLTVIRDVELSDRTNFLQRLRFLFEAPINCGMYQIMESGAGNFGGGTVALSESQRNHITSSPAYPTLTYHNFGDWMYIALVESADVGRPTAPGSQDWYTEFTPLPSGSNILDSEDNVVMSPLGTPFKTGATSIQYLLKARQYTSGPICVSQPVEPPEGFLAGIIGGEQTAHTITINWSGFRPTFPDDSDAAGTWQPVGYDVSPNRNSNLVHILLAPI